MGRISSPMPPSAELGWHEKMRSRLKDTKARSPPVGLGDVQRICHKSTGSWHEVVATFILTHYLLYSLPVLGCLWIIHRSELVPAAVFWLLVSVYVASMLFYKPHKGRGWCWARSLYTWGYWDHLLRFFNATLVRRAPLDPSRAYLFAISPHGILSVFRCLFVGSSFPQLFPGIYGRWCGATPMFLTPFGCRETMLLFQAIDASKRVLERALGRGESLFLIPGGTKELILTDPLTTETQFAIADRMGFVRLAIEQGVPIVPVVAFGEKWAYHKLTFPRALQKVLYKLLLPGVWFYGWCGTLLPRTTRDDGTPLQLAVVFGTPIEVDKMVRTDAGYDQQVSEVHAKYSLQMTEIFNTHKSEFGYQESETLALVDANPATEATKAE